MMRREETAANTAVYFPWGKIELYLTSTMQQSCSNFDNQYMVSSFLVYDDSTLSNVTLQ